MQANIYLYVTDLQNDKCFRCFLLFIHSTFFFDKSSYDAANVHALS